MRCENVFVVVVLLRCYCWDTTVWTLSNTLLPAHSVYRICISVPVNAKLLCWWRISFFAVLHKGTLCALLELWPVFCTAVAKAAVTRSRRHYYCFITHSDSGTVRVKCNKNSIKQKKSMSGIRTRTPNALLDFITCDICDQLLSYYRLPYLTAIAPVRRIGISNAALLPVTIFVHNNKRRCQWSMRLGRNCNDLGLSRRLVSVFKKILPNTLIVSRLLTEVPLSWKTRTRNYSVLSAADKQ